MGYKQLFIWSILCIGAVCGIAIGLFEDRHYFYSVLLIFLGGCLIYPLFCGIKHSADKRIILIGGITTFCAEFIFAIITAWKIVPGNHWILFIALYIICGMPSYFIFQKYIDLHENKDENKINKSIRYESKKGSSIKIDNEEEITINGLSDNEIIDRIASFQGMDRKEFLYNLEIQNIASKNIILLIRNLTPDIPRQLIILSNQYVNSNIFKNMQEWYNKEFSSYDRRFDLMANILHIFYTGKENNLNNYINIWSLRFLNNKLVESLNSNSNINPLQQEALLEQTNDEFQILLSLIKIATRNPQRAAELAERIGYTPSDLKYLIQPPLYEYAQKMITYMKKY